MSEKKESKMFEEVIDWLEKYEDNMSSALVKGDGGLDEADGYLYEEDVTENIETFRGC